MFSLRCFLFNNHKITENKVNKNNTIESTFVCSRCEKNEREIMSEFDFKSEEDVVKILNKKLFKI